MTTQPGSFDFTIYQGATFGHVISWKDENDQAINLSGYTSRMHLRVSKDSETAFLTLTTENSRIALGGALGTITLSISAADTALLSEAGGVYDLELISSGGNVTRLLEGNIIISREVTR